MATFLSKLFKPKWQNKHLPTRLEAINALDANQNEDQQALISVIETDSHIDARKAAIGKLNLSQPLIDLHAKVDQETQAIIEQRLYELAEAQSLTIYDLIVDLSLLSDMIIKSDKPDVFIRGLARIEDPKTLLSIAQQAKTSKIRQAAAELIESETQLNELVQSAKSKDKSVYQLAKGKLSKIRSEHKEREETEKTLNTIIGSLREHAKTDNTKLYSAKLTSLQQRWEAISGHASSALLTQFNEANQQCVDKLSLLNKETQDAEDRDRLEKAGGDEQEATLLTLQDTLDRFRSVPASTQEVSALDAIVKTQETRWLEATKHSKVDKSQNKHYQVLMTELRQYLSALKRLGECSGDLEQTISNINSAKNDPRRLGEHIRRLTQIISSISWPSNYSEPNVLQKAHDALGRSEDVKAQLAKNAKDVLSKINASIAKLDKYLEEKQIKDSSNTYREIQGLLSQLDSKQSAPIHSKLTLRVNQLNELKDWQGYASTPRQIELCEQMERLAEQHIEPREKANKIKAMQSEWKSLGGASDQSLWERFKAASDQAYVPCKAFFEEQNALKKTNLERRMTLIEQLKEFIEKTDWQAVDWKSVEQINKKARSDWRDAFPVDFKANKKYQAEFNQLLESLDEHLKVEYDKNAQLKQGIVEKAQALAESLKSNTGTLDDAIQEAKSLQQDWKNVGSTQHKADRKLWKEFRAACDAIFDVREQQKAARQEETTASLEEANKFCEELEQFNGTNQSAPLSELNSALTDFRKRFKQLPSLPSRAQEKIIARYEKALKVLKASISSGENRQRFVNFEELKRRSGLIRDFYSDRQDGNQTDLEAAEVSLSSDVNLESALETKLKSLWISVKAGSVSDSHLMTPETAKNHCIRCEIAAGIESPESDKELRMQLQVSRLSEGMSSGVEHQTREEQLIALVDEWYLMIGLKSDEIGAYETRIESAFKALFGE